MVLYAYRGTVPCVQSAESERLSLARTFHTLNRHLTNHEGRCHGLGFRRLCIPLWVVCRVVALLRSYLLGSNPIMILHGTAVFPIWSQDAPCEVALTESPHLVSISW